MSSHVVTATIDGYSIANGDNATFVASGGWCGLGSPGVRRVSQPRPRQHGSLEATSLWGPRVMPVRGWCGQVPGDADDAAVAIEAFDTLKALLTPGPHELVLRRPGRSVDEAMTVWVASDVELTGSDPGGTVLEWAVDLVAPDPLLYGTAEQSAVSVNNGGLTIPAVGGKVPTPASLTVRGPTTSGGGLTLGDGLGGVVSLTNITPALPAYDFDDPDSYFTVFLGERVVGYLGNSMTHWVDAANTSWWHLRPGAPVLVTMGGSARQAGTRLEVTWHEARI